MGALWAAKFSRPERRLEGTTACQQLANSLDHRGRRERALKHSLADHPELLAARRSAAQTAEQTAEQPGSSASAAAADVSAAGEAAPQESKPEPMEE